MAASYDPALPRPLDRLRSNLGDTEIRKALLPDETYTAALVAAGADEAVAVRALAAKLIAQFSNRPTRITQAGVTVDYAARLDIWRDIAFPASGGGDGSGGIAGSTVRSVRTVRR